MRAALLTLFAAFVFAAPQAPISRTLTSGIDTSLRGLSSAHANGTEIIWATGSNGVILRSPDAGKTWTHLGLRDAQQIPQIVVDPKNPNRVFAAVLGHPYGPNEQRGVYRSLGEAEVADTGLAAGAYDLVVSCLVDEHLADLRPLYAEAARLATPGGRFVLIGFHPHFIIASGMPTHFDDAESGEPVAIETHVHLLSDHVAAGLGAGLALAGLNERIVDDEWLALKPKWERFRDHPVSFAFVWSRP